MNNATDSNTLTFKKSMFKQTNRKQAVVNKLVSLYLREADRKFRLPRT